MHCFQSVGSLVRVVVSNGLREGASYIGLVVVTDHGDEEAYYGVRGLFGSVNNTQRLDIDAWPSYKFHHRITVLEGADPRRWHWVDTDSVVETLATEDIYHEER